MTSGSTPPVPGHLRTYVASAYGGALSNTLHKEGVTCQVCAAPVDGYPRCSVCQRRASTLGLADIVGSVIYAVSGQQSHYLMRSYKGSPAVQESRVVVFLLAWLALSDHGGCLERLTGHAVTHWSSVPSLPAKAGEHPLHALVASIAPGQELPLDAASYVAPGCARAVNAAHYRAAATVLAGSHVLIIDDTWAGGGHAQSSALAVRAAGAGAVSILNVARFLQTSWVPTAAFLREHPRRDFDPATCPWTGGACPRSLSAPLASPEAG